MAKNPSKGETFLISDLHFFHTNILNFEPTARPFKSLDEMHEEMVKRWNSVVTPNDHVWVLGDVAFGKPENLEILRRLNGTKRLVMGNHDMHDSDVYLKYFKRVCGVVTLGKICMTHVPIHPSQFYRFDYNVHGHLHSKVVMKEDGSGPDARYINVSAEHLNMTPINLQTLREVYMGG